MVLAKFFLMSFALLILTHACTTNTIRPPSVRELKQAHEEGKSVVFFRFRPQHSADPSLKHSFSVWTANMTVAEIPKKMDWNAPSSAAMDEGWYYFLLEPGTYYLAAAFSRYTWPETLYPDFWFHVPDGRSLIYIGSLYAPCRTESDDQGTIVSEYSVVHLSDESTHAKEIAEHSFGNLLPLSMHLMQQYRSVSKQPLLGGANDMAIVSRPWANISAPNLRKRAMGQVLGSGGWEHLLPNRVDDAPFSAALLGLYIPTAAFIGAVKGAVDVEKWKPCLEGLNKEFEALDHTSTEQRMISDIISKQGLNRLISIKEEADSFSAASKAGVKTMLQMEIQRLQIKEFGRTGTFCIDMALHVRIWNLELGRYTFNRVFVYTGVPESLRAYEIHIEPRPLCRKMSFYCSGDGRKAFRQEITFALQQIAEMISADITAH